MSFYVRLDETPLTLITFMELSQYPEFELHRVTSRVNEAELWEKIGSILFKKISYSWFTRCPNDFFHVTLIKLNPVAATATDADGDE